MYKISFALLMLIFIEANGQSPHSAFIEKSSVSWASYVTDTFRFTQINFNHLLREMFDKGKIKVHLDDINQSDHYATKEDVINRMAPNRVIQVADADGNITHSVMEADNPLFAAKYFDGETNNGVEIEQILYIQSGKLKTYSYSASPKYTVVTSWGDKLGTANIFKTTFKNKQHISRSVKNHAALLGTTITRISIKSPDPQSLKQMYGQNIIQAIWPYLNDRDFEFTDITSNEKIRFTQISQHLIGGPVINVPHYDEMGKLINIEKAGHSPFNVADINTIALEQQWFYHRRKNRLFNNITTALLFANKWSNGSREESASPVLKIIIKQ